MHFSTALIFAIASSSLAMASPHLRKRSSACYTTTVTVTASSTSTKVEATSKTISTSTKTTKSTASSSTFPASPLNTKSTIIEVVNYWRLTAGVGDLIYNSTLVANAAKTGKDDKGVNEVHELNPGSYAQVITPGLQVDGDFNLEGDTPFELAYVGWLCEKPTAALTDGKVNQCALVKKIENLVYSGTAHSDILTYAAYTSIGCAFTQNPDAKSGSPYQGLWVCDLGYQGY